MTYFIISMLLCLGLILILNITPSKLFTAKGLSFKQIRANARGETKQNFITRQFMESQEILEMTGRGKEYEKYKRCSVILAITGSVIGLALLNPPLALVLALTGIMAPVMAVKFMASRFKKQLSEEIFTSLSLVTSSFRRTENLIQAVQEHIGHFNPPVSDLFQEFLRQYETIDPSISRALNRIKPKLDNEIWQEWCDDMQLCLSDPTKKDVLPSVIKKSTEQNRIQGNLDALLDKPVVDTFGLMLIVIANIPVATFFYQEWSVILWQSIQGKFALAVIAAACLYAIYKSIHASRPIEFRKVAK